MFLESIHYQSIFKSKNLKKVDSAYWFVVNNQRMTGASFSRTLQSIQDILVEQDVEYGVLMMAHGTYVFTEGEINLDPVVTKLETGVNFEGKITNSDGLIAQINNWLEGSRKA